MENEDCSLIEYEIERRKLAEPLRFFKPNDAQIRYIESIKKQDSDVCLFPAGNWCGKTAVAIVCLAAAIWPELAEDEIFNCPLFKNWPYPKNARIITTPKEMSLTGSIQKEIKAWFPKGQYTSSNQGKMYPSLFTARGWNIDSMTYDQSITEFEGGTFGIIIENEPPPEQIYDAMEKRKKFGGKTLMPMTPLADSAWVWDKLVKNDGTNGIYVTYGDTEDNCREHSKHGVIPHDAIEKMASKCDPDDREARLHGKFIHLAGQIFKSFNRDIHTFKLDTGLTHFLGGKETYQIVDPAIGKPLAVIYAAVSANGVIEIYDEYPQGIEFQGMKDSNLTVKDYAELFRSKEEGRTITTRILDRHFGNTRRTLGGLTLKQEFAEEGIEFIDSYTSDDKTEIETGILKVKELLRYNKDKPIDSLNRPRLMVADHCTNTIHALERWSRDAKTGKPREEQKDFADCVRYLAMANPEVNVYRPWQENPAHYGVGN